LTKVTYFETAGQIDKTVEYVYDTFDRRVSSKVTDYTTNGSGVAVAGTPVVETYVYDEGAQSRGDVLLDFVDSDGPSGNAAAVSKRYLWGQAVDQLFAQEDVANQLLAETDRYAWLLQDRLNTVREVLNRDGSVAAHIDYDSFGEIESVTDASGSPTALPTRFTFTGQELDSNTGMSFYSDGTGDGRWLSHAQNRFISRDAIPVGPGNRNLYAYATNQPTGFIDPSGREPKVQGPELPPHMRPKSPDRTVDEIIRDTNRDEQRGPTREELDRLRENDIGEYRRWHNETIPGPDYHYDFDRREWVYRDRQWEVEHYGGITPGPPTEAEALCQHLNDYGESFGLFGRAFGPGCALDITCGIIAGVPRGSAGGGPAAKRRGVPNRPGPTHGHHSDPNFMGGNPKQPRTPMSPEQHRELHKDLNDFLRQKTDEAGNHMRPQRGNPGRDIRRNFTPEQRREATAEFYKKFESKYPDAARDFFNQHPDLR